MFAALCALSSYKKRISRFHILFTEKTIDTKHTTSGTGSRRSAVLSKGSQQNRMLSSPSNPILLTSSRKGSPVATRRHSWIYSQARTNSNSLVGLPGAGTSALLDTDFNIDNIDPAIINGLPNVGDDFFQEFIAPATTNVGTAHGSYDFGMNLVPASSHRDQPDLYGMPINSAFDATTFDTQYTDIFTDARPFSIGLSATPRGKRSKYDPPEDYDYAHPSRYVHLAQSPKYTATMSATEKTDYPHQHASGTRTQPAGLGLEAGTLYSPRRSNRVETEVSRGSKLTRKQSYSSSEEDAPIIKRRKAYRKRASGKGKPQPHANSDISRRGSILSQTSDDVSLDELAEVEPVRAGQKPKRHEEKSWVRVNSSTKGTTTRTTRINQLAEATSKYKHKPLPVGDWKSSGFKFKYIHHLNMDEFKKQSMSARQVHEYITQFPSDELRIWIQIAPGDSARRYASESHSRCIFEKCPNRMWGGKSTIEVGSYRVAFDEKHKKYGKGVCDPFDCVGYAHLYCMERFLDFPGICETADVKVDDRSGFKKEPKAVAPFTFLNNKHVYDKLVAEKFVKAAHMGALHRTPEFRNYPNHCDYTRGEAKPHADTLVAALFKSNLAHRTRSQIKQFVNRKILPGVFPIHQGDQEMANIDKMVAELPDYQDNVNNGVHRADEMTSYYDRFFPEVNIRIQDCLELRAKIKREDSLFGAPTRGGGKKRQFVKVEDSDSDDEPECPRNTRRGNQQNGRHGNQRSTWRSSPRSPYQESPTLRSSPRKRQRTDYAAESKPLSQQYPDDHFSQIAQLLPQYHRPLSPTASNTPVSAAYPASRNESCSQFFIQHLGDDAIDMSTFDALSPLVSAHELSHRKASALSNGPYSLPSIPAQPITPHNALSLSSIVSQQITPRNTLSMSSILSQHTTPRSPRTASFNAHPVSSEQEFAINDPPSKLQAQSEFPAITRAIYEHGQQQRRSTRIASRAGSLPSSPTSLGRVQAARVNKSRS